MNLPFFSSREPQKNFFLSLLIKPFKIGAILFEEINGKLFILSTNETATGKETSELTEEELLHAADRVISFVEGSLPEGSSVEKTIFSVPYNWVEEGKIMRDYLLRLKGVCDNLGLVPMGYLVSIEAVVSFLQASEGAPVSGIFIEVAEARVFLYLVRAGKILEVHSKLVEKSILKTAENLLGEIDSVDVLPSKIILLDYKGAEGIQQEFLSYHWPKDIPFLHIPQVVVLERGFENEATINGVASQMELEVLADVRAEQSKTPQEETLEEIDTLALGFMKEKDIAHKEEEGEGSKEETGQKKEDEEGAEPNVKYFKKEDQDSKIQEEDLGKKLSSFPIQNILSIAKNLKIPKIGNLFSFSLLLGANKPFKGKLIVFVIGILIFIFLFSYLYYNFILRAEIVISADKKAVDKTANVTFEENAKNDNSINVLLLEKEVKGQDSRNSTGKKETGDRARGEVTIYNKTDQKKTFSKGTVLVSPQDLEFELESEVNIASTSPFSTTLSSAKGKVLGAKFGKEYNLPSNSNFTVKGLSTGSYIAKNLDAITGGTKKETTVVSKKDLGDLLSSVIKKLEKTAISQAQKDKGLDEEIFPKALSFVVSQEKYTKKEGDEAGSVGIEATINFTLGQYKRKDIEKIVKSISSSEVPGTYALLEGESKVDITNIKVDQKEKSASATLSVNAIYTPKIEPLELAEALKGKKEETAKKQIESIVGVTRVLINLKNKLPFFPKNLPQNSKSILIEVNN